MKKVLSGKTRESHPLIFFITSFLKHSLVQIKPENYITKA